MAERTLHLVEERQFRDIYLPSVAGDEDALNELLEWVSLLSTSWEPRSQAYAIVKEARGQWKAALEGRRIGDVAPRTQDFASRVLNSGYGVLSAFRRPAFVMPKGLSLSSLDPLGFKDLAAFVVDGSKMLEGATQVPSWMKDTAKALPGPGPAAGPLVPKENVARFLKTVRSAMPKHAQRLESAGIAAEPALALFVSAFVEAKDNGAGVLELEDALNGPKGVIFPPENVRSHALGNLPGAVLREVKKALGGTVEPMKPLEPTPRAAPPPKVDHGPAVPYSPRESYPVGQLLIHKKFGQGEVKRILDKLKILVLFDGTERVLAQNAAERPPGTPEPSSQEELTPVTDLPPAEPPPPPPRYHAPAAQPRARRDD